MPKFQKKRRINAEIVDFFAMPESMRLAVLRELGVARFYVQTGVMLTILVGIVEAGFSGRAGAGIRLRVDP